ncbi:TPA: hypothetical protein ENX78_11945 [Candidatus Poribacteria bacterium]|nr:hypothetical protein [Candidatus Poribacteria bacterium]
MAKKILYILCAVIIAGLAGYWILHSRDVSNLRTRADEIRTDISTAQQQQQQAVDRINHVETGLGNVQATVTHVSEGIGITTNTISTIEERIDASQDGLKSSADLIAEGQRILQTVRARGKLAN